MNIRLRVPFTRVELQELRTWAKREGVTLSMLLEACLREGVEDLGARMLQQDLQEETNIEEE